MSVLKSSISVQVSKRIFGIINKSPNKHFGVGGEGKNSKVSNWGNVYLALKSNLLQQSFHKRPNLFENLNMLLLLATKTLRKS